MRYELVKLKWHQLPHYNNRKSRTVHLITEADGQVETAEFFCPCGCGKWIALNLLSKLAPPKTLWRVDCNTISIQPSVQVFEGCKSHFSIKDGQVIWHS